MNSGTVEKMVEHLATDKPAIIYFSTAPVRLDSVDNALLEFKESCRSRGLVEEFEELAAFREKFTRHLAQTIIRLFANKTSGEDTIENRFNGNLRWRHRNSSMNRLRIPMGLLSESVH